METVEWRGTEVTETPRLLTMAFTYNMYTITQHFGQKVPEPEIRRVAEQCRARRIVAASQFERVQLFQDITDEELNKATCLPVLGPASAVLDIF